MNASRRSAPEPAKPGHSTPTSSAPALPRHEYDKVTIRLHWATALLVTVLWLMGRTTGFLPRGPLRVDIWSVHVVLGITLACVLFGRLFWRAAYGRALPHAYKGIIQLLATTTHRLLYVLLVVVVTLGLINVPAHAFPLFNVWHFPKLGDDAFMRRINNWHGLMANTLAAVALLHACAALFHHYAMKDTVLARMWPGSRRPASHD